MAIICISSILLRTQSILQQYPYILPLYIVWYVQGKTLMGVWSPEWPKNHPWTPKTQNWLPKGHPRNFHISILICRSDTLQFLWTPWYKIWLPDRATLKNERNNLMYDRTNYAHIYANQVKCCTNVWVPEGIEQINYRSKQSTQDSSGSVHSTKRGFLYHCLCLSTHVLAMLAGQISITPVPMTECFAYTL